LHTPSLATHPSARRPHTRLLGLAGSVQNDQPRNTRSPSLPVCCVPVLSIRSHCLVHVGRADRLQVNQRLPHALGDVPPNLWDGRAKSQVLGSSQSGLAPPPRKIDRQALDSKLRRLRMTGPHVSPPRFISAAPRRYKSAWADRRIDTGNAFLGARGEGGVDDLGSHY
jgi:hypothetical protein